MNDGLEDSFEEVPDRRRTRRRHHFEEHGIASARVRPGQEALLIDVSAGGALVETLYRMLPGAAIELQFAGGERRAAVRGRVLRCAVAHLRGAEVWYRGAIRFEERLPWFVDDEEAGYGVLRGEVRPWRSGRGDVTPQVQ